MEITVFGRNIHFLTTEQIEKLKEFLFVTIGNNYSYIFAIICFFSYVILCIIFRFNKNKRTDKHTAMVAEFILYVLFLLCALVFSRPIGERSIIKWNRSLFLTAHGYHETSLLMAISKFCMVIPFGIILKKIFRISSFRLILSAALTGAIIECLKYFLGRGRAAVGSAIVLALGTFVGICWETVKHSCRYLGERDELDEKKNDI